MEKDISCKWKGKKSWGTSTQPDKMDFKKNAIVRDKEAHYIMIKGTIQQEDIALVNIHTPNIGVINMSSKS